MDIQFYLANLQRDDNQTAQLASVDKLFLHAGNRLVFNSLCATALGTRNIKVRSRIITLMKPHAERACRRFAQIAANPATTREHRLALVNLNLLKCPSARAHAVIHHGLNHPDFEIQKAAFMSTGLFDDPILLREVERFMERNRFLLVLDGVRAASSEISKFIKGRQTTKRVHRTHTVHWLGGRVKT